VSCKRFVDDVAGHDNVRAPVHRGAADTEGIELPSLGAAYLEELARDIVTDWRQRPLRRRQVRPIVPSDALPSHHARRRTIIADELWDDRAEQDAEQLVGLLFVAAEPLKRAEIRAGLRISPARLARGCGVSNGRV
jgi:hypothetical protein